jgi:hypothetical protein
MKQFAARAIWTTLPIPGVLIDINDLGLVSGIALVLLTGVFLVCISREHENVFLALYNVRQICSDEGVDCAKGGSRANLLYHALAASQALNAPPTLARWQPHGTFRYLRILFLAPAFVHLWVFWWDWTTQYVAWRYGVDNLWILAFELASTVVLFAFGVAAWAHSSAMAVRWENTFSRINPRRALMPQASVVEWLKIFPSRDPLKHLQQRVITEIVDVGITDAQPRSECHFTPDPLLIDSRGPKPRRREITRSVKTFVERSSKTASLKCADEKLGRFVALKSFTIVSSSFEQRRWVVTGSWSFEVERPLEVSRDRAETRQI